jgi:hypothetical protein
MLCGIKQVRKQSIQAPIMLPLHHPSVVKYAVVSEIQVYAIRSSQKVHKIVLYHRVADSVTACHIQCRGVFSPYLPPSIICGYRQKKLVDPTYKRTFSIFTHISTIVATICHAYDMFIILVLYTDDTMIVSIICGCHSKLVYTPSKLSFPDTATTKAKPAALDLRTKDVILTDITNHVVRC